MIIEPIRPIVQHPLHSFLVPCGENRRRVRGLLWPTLMEHLSNHNLVTYTIPGHVGFRPIPDVSPSLDMSVLRDILEGSRCDRHYTLACRLIPILRRAHLVQARLQSTPGSFRRAARRLSYAEDVPNSPTRWLSMNLGHVPIVLNYLSRLHFVDREALIAAKILLVPSCYVQSRDLIVSHPSPNNSHWLITGGYEVGPWYSTNGSVTGECNPPEDTETNHLPTVTTWCTRTTSVYSNTTKPLPRSGLGRITAKGYESAIPDLLGFAGYLPIPPALDQTFRDITTALAAAGHHQGAPLTQAGRALAFYHLRQAPAWVLIRPTVQGPLVWLPVRPRRAPSGEGSIDYAHIVLNSVDLESWQAPRPEPLTILPITNPHQLFGHEHLVGHRPDDPLDHPAGRILRLGQMRRLQTSA